MLVLGVPRGGTAVPLAVGWVLWGGFLSSRTYREVETRRRTTFCVVRWSGDAGNDGLWGPFYPYRRQHKAVGSARF